MSEQWIKWHTQTLENDIFHTDWTAWHIFEALCLKAYTGKPPGTVVITTRRFADFLGCNSGTLYKSIKRLEKAKMVNTSVNTSETTINICNWPKFQSVGKHLEEQPVNTRETLGKHFAPVNDTQSIDIRYKNIDTNVSSRVSNETSTSVQKLYELYLQEFETTEPRFKLTPARRAKLGLRVKDAGYDLTAQAIRNTAASSWHRGENDRGWKANLDFIVRTYEQVEKLAEMEVKSNIDRDAEELRAKWMTNNG